MPEIVIELFSQFGTALAIIVAMIFFLWLRVWPWWVKRDKQKRDEESEEKKELREAQVLERKQFIEILNKQESRNEKFADVLHEQSQALIQVKNTVNSGLTRITELLEWIRRDK